MLVTVTFYPFGQEMKVEFDSLEEALSQISAYHKLTSGIADYEIKVR